MMVQVKVVRTKIANQPWRGYWGAEEGPITSVIESATITYKGAQYSLPRSAFADLAQINSVSCQKLKKQLNVRINGSDAGASYDAVWSFQAGSLIKRIVSSGEFPREHREETVYINKPIKEAASPGTPE
jgi:hypothetical protein